MSQPASNAAQAPQAAARTNARTRLSEASATVGQ
jgi:hypothetical protein